MTEAEFRNISMQRRKALSRLQRRSQACLIRLFVTNLRQTSGAFLRFWLILQTSRSSMPIAYARCWQIKSR